MSSKSTERTIKVGIIGLGMVGDPIRQWFEEHKGYIRGKDLFCYDTDPKKDYNDDVNKADVVFVSVPTPSNPDGSCNISIVDQVADTVNDGKIIVIKSTVTPGTIERLQKKYPKKKFIFNPEFLTESQSWLDFLKPDRQLMGHTSKSYSDARELLELMPKAHFERPWSSDYTKKDMSATEAELTKYASNVFGYIKVIYGNILADITYGLSLDLAKNQIEVDLVYNNIREAMSADPRIGAAWLNVEHGNYCGAGGYCFPKDMRAFTSFIDSLIKRLGKLKKNDAIVKNLTKGVAVLKAVSAYNETLLHWQGLSLHDVSFHDKEIVTSKRKPIRNQEE